MIINLEESFRLDILSVSFQFSVYSIGILLWLAVFRACLPLSAVRAHIDLISCQAEQSSGVDLKYMI